MYKIECNKSFSHEPEIPFFCERLSHFLTGNGKKVAYFKNEFDNSTFRYRYTNFAHSLVFSSRYTVSCFLAKEIPEILKYIDQIDIIIFQRADWSPEIDILIRIAKSRKIPVVYDMDDLLFSTSNAISYINHVGLPYSNINLHTFFGITTAYETIAKQCDAFIATVPFLAKKITEYFDKPCFVIPNFLNPKQIEESEFILNNRIYAPERFHIGYFSGSPSHLIDLKTIEKDLAKLINKYSNIDLVIVGMLDLSSGPLHQLQKNGRVIFRKFVPFEALQYEIGKVDVNIAPLQLDAFNEAKSELKFFEAAIVKVPSCVASTEIYSSVVTDSTDGFVCKDGEWFSKLEQLYLDQQLRENMANAAYKTATEKYSPKCMTDIICDIYDKLIAL